MGRRPCSACTRRDILQKQNNHYLTELYPYVGVGGGTGGGGNPPPKVKPYVVKYEFQNSLMYCVPPPEVQNWTFARPRMIVSQHSVTKLTRILFATVLSSFSYVFLNKQSSSFYISAAKKYRNIANVARNSVSIIWPGFFCIIICRAGHQVKQI